MRMAVSLATGSQHLYLASVMSNVYMAFSLRFMPVVAVLSRLDRYSKAVSGLSDIMESAAARMPLTLFVVSLLHEYARQHAAAVRNIFRKRFI